MSSNENKRKLLEKPNVVAAGTAKEEKNGERTGRETLTAFVHKDWLVSGYGTDEI